MSRFLLTGASGFIGSAVLRKLVRDGHEVVALQSGPSAQKKMPGVEWHGVDLLRACSGELRRLVKEANVSHCIHAAWYTNHADYLMAEINQEWTDASVRLFEAFGGGQRFLGLGTCFEYDQNDQNGAFSEERTAIRPETLYARCKAALFEQLSKRFGDDEPDFVWARIFFVYGPADRPGRLIPYILDGLRNGERLKPRFGGLVRDYIHTEDLAGQLVAIASSDIRGPINVGTGRALRLAEIFRLAGELAGRLELVDENDLIDPAQAERIEADMSRYRQHIGDLGTRSFREGLAQIMAEEAA